MNYKMIGGSRDGNTYHSDDYLTIGDIRHFYLPVKHYDAYELRKDGKLYFIGEGTMKLKVNDVEFVIHRVKDDFELVSISISDDLDHLSFSDWESDVEDLDNKWSDPASCWGHSTHLKYKNVEMWPSNFTAKSFDELREALSKVTFTVYDPQEI